MFSSAELIQYLRRRARVSLRPERPPGEFPPGWQDWFVLMRQRMGVVTGASAAAIIAVFIQRELTAPPARTIDLNRWQSFATLWRQEWRPPEPEDHRVRLAAGAATLLIHLFLLVALLWLAYVRFTGMPAAAEQGEAIVQVEYIGEGTPLERGGGLQAGEVADPADAASPPPAAAAQAPASTPSATDLAQPPPSDPAPPQEPAVPAAQPLQLTIVPIPDSTFTLPAPTPRDIELVQPRITLPALQQSTQPVEIVEVPMPAQPLLRIQPVQAPTIDRQVPDVAVRAAPAPVSPVRLRVQTVAKPSIVAPTLRAPSPQDIPGEATDAAASPATTATTTPAAGSTPTAAGTTPTGVAPTPGGEPSTRSGSQPATAAAGSGEAPTPKPGAWPTPGRNDDWGQSSRNRPGGSPGGKPGLFNPDGSPRLPPGMAAPGGGLPPGTIEEGISDLDRAGTWLKRPPYDYEPTSFDRFWRPHETLLQEWVRRSIRTVLIPIPGTGKKIRCDVTLLALGGGCGILDPNLNNQNARARPPPEVPFKPELQEDQESLGE